jgi:hypothetical protein
MNQSLTRLSAIAAGETNLGRKAIAEKKLRDAMTRRLQREVAAKRRARRKGRAG